MAKCEGCGVELQTTSIMEDGYTPLKKNKLCNRCFQIKHYNNYIKTHKKHADYEAILSNINKTRSLVLLISDFFNEGEDLREIRNYFDNDIILVLNKRDALPLSINDEKIIEYYQNKYPDLFIDIVIVSSTKNYNFDKLYRTILDKKKTKKVYVVGNSNVGKSTLINKMISNYGVYDMDLTVSPYLSTTLDEVVVKIDDDLTLIDTPGLVDMSNFNSHIDNQEAKNLKISKEIKPITYQIRKKQALLIGDYFRIDYLEGEKNSFTFYMSNNIKVKKVFFAGSTRLKNLPMRTFELNYGEDLVIKGLGFIKIVKECKINVYGNVNVDIYIRKSLV